MATRRVLLVVMLVSFRQFVSAQSLAPVASVPIQSLTPAVPPPSLVPVASVPIQSLAPAVPPPSLVPVAPAQSIMLVAHVASTYALDRDTLKQQLMLVTGAPSPAVQVFVSLEDPTVVYVTLAGPGAASYAATAMIASQSPNSGLNVGPLTYAAASDVPLQSPTPVRAVGTAALVAGILLAVGLLLLVAVAAVVALKRRRRTTWSEDCSHLNQAIVADCLV